MCDEQATCDICSEILQRHPESVTPAHWQCDGGCGREITEAETLWSQEDGDQGETFPVARAWCHECFLQRHDRGYYPCLSGGCRNLVHVLDADTFSQLHALEDLDLADNQIYELGRRPGR